MYKKTFNKIVSFFLVPVLKCAVRFFKSETFYIEEELQKAKYVNVTYPEVYIRYLIYSEDKRFFTHYGVDFFAICRAFIKTVFLRKLQGASTIEQQLVRTMLKDYRISIIRKMKEQVLAAFISAHYSKNDLAIIYLNIAYVGKFDRKLPASNFNDHALSLVAAIRYPVPGEGNLKWEARYNARKKMIQEGFVK